MKIDKTLFASDKHEILDLLQSSDWPQATPEFLICKDDEDGKKERADGILDYIDFDLDGKSLLDFGCGEGHIAAKAAERGANATGYDIAKSGNLTWEDGLLTTDFTKISDRKFDMVFIYDVLDHCKEPVQALNQVKSVSTDATKIFIRFHPWMSRHGSHLYKQINKAWIHLFFSEEDLQKMGLEMEFIQKIIYPIKTYNKWIKEAQLKVVKIETIKTSIEPFFKKPQVDSPEFSKMKEKWFKELYLTGQIPVWQMSQTFNDYEISL